MDTLRRDLQYALRIYRRAPVFAVVVLATIALTIGAATAVFAVVQAALLEHLPYPNADRIVIAEDMAPGNILDWRAASHSFAAIAAVREGQFDLTAGDRPERVDGAVVTSSFFDVVAVRPALGRVFAPGDDTSGGHVAILSDGLWRRRFGADSGIVGRSVVMNGEAFTIVGVMPAGFAAPPDAADVWVAPRHVVPDHPLYPGMDMTQNRGGHYLAAWMRLAPGVTLQAAQAEERAIFTRLVAQYPAEMAAADADITLVPLREWLVGDIAPALLILFGVVLLVLLIGCANIANLMLARSSARAQEMSVRSALGAGGRRLVRQMLTESVLLAVAGGALGVLAASWALPVLLSWAPADVRGVHATLNPRVMFFAFAVSLVTGLVFGVVPAVQAARSSVADALRSMGRTTDGRHGRRLRQSLIVAECAASVALLVVAGLLLRSFVSLQRVNPGFTAAGLQTARIGLPTARYASPASQAQFFNRLLEETRSAPGVTEAALAARLPFVGGNSTRSFQLDRPTPGIAPEAGIRVISPGYFEVLGQPLHRGRSFTDHDTAGAPNVAVINEAMARRYWPNQDAMGRHFTLDLPDSRPIEVVGIAGDVKHGSLREPLAAEFYVPYRQMPWSFMSLVVKTPLGTAAASKTIDRTLTTIDPALPMPAVHAMPDLITASVSLDRFEMLGLAIFAGVALTLAVIGFYGVMAYLVSRRSREMGLRIALGATRAGILRLVMADGLRLTAAGLAIGLIAAVGAARAVRGNLYGVQPFDPMTFAGVALILIAVALLASYIPARRAMAVDPMNAVRGE